jgi:hypothetical protein
MSGSRNGIKTRDGDWDYERSVDASCCYWCRDRFAAGQMRYPILHEWKCEPVSLCLDCFKCPDAESYDPAAIQASAAADRKDFEEFLARKNLSLPPKRRKPVAPRKETTCPGCGEPIFVAPNLRSYQLQFCSMRCYEREYRKRRGEYGRGSTIDWKVKDGHDHNSQCATCKKRLRSKRKDARYCSSACRQFAYRARQRPGPDAE